MATIETKIWQALKARINTLALSYAKDWQGSDFTLSDEPYLEIRLFPNISERMVIESDGKHRYKGILQISLKYPISLKHSFETMQEIAGKIAEHFPVDLIMSFDGVNVSVEKRADVAQPFREEGFWNFPITIRYYSYS